MRLETLHIIDSPWSAVLLRGNLIAFGDHSSTTVLMDWTTQESATLESASDPTIPRQVRPVKIDSQMWPSADSDLVEQVPSGNHPTLERRGYSCSRPSHRCLSHSNPSTIVLQTSPGHKFEEQLHPASLELHCSPHIRLGRKYFPQYAYIPAQPQLQRSRPQPPQRPLGSCHGQHPSRLPRHLSAPLHLSIQSIIA